MLRSYSMHMEAHMPHHYKVLRELATSYRHIFLSPHLDDAALSCGGMIARYAANQQPVLVVNVCTAAPPPKGPFSSFAEENHRRWRLAPEAVVTQRLIEDAAALDMLGADSYQLDMLDAIYRMPHEYMSNGTLFGAVAANDPLPQALIEPLTELASRFADAIVYAPLGVGQHVDHQALYQAALAMRTMGLSLALYEDFPYVAVEGALAARLEQLGGRDYFMSTTIDIDPWLARKIGAIECYASQLDALFGGSAPMAASVTAYTESVRPDVGTYGERIWLPR
jgi:LmbE family N-acetylglucosaminyl deacetylase